jgi:uncharacterized protein
MLALFYDLVPDYVERRGPLREEHLGLARAALERGDLLLAGAFSDSPDQSLFVWRTDDQAAVHAFVDADPYVAHGLVVSWTVRHWAVAVGY